MLGAIIGDIIGSRWEFTPTNDYHFELFSDENNFTDDTICTIAVADAILHNSDDFGKYIHSWCRRYPQPMGGYGGRFNQWVMSDHPQPYGSCGNGAAMRVSPVAWAIFDRHKVLDLAKKVAVCTHNHPEGIKGAQTVALAIHQATMLHDEILNGIEGMKELMAYATGFSKYNINIRLEDVQNRFDETCQGTVPVALWIIYQSHSFEDAIRRAISLGADADTLGAIVGSIAEAIWGIPNWMRERALTYLPDEMVQVVELFYRKALVQQQVRRRLTDPFREPRQLVNDFINEHLNGNINKLIDYDFRQLKGIERYGDTEGYSFDIYRTQLVRAIATLVFKDIAPKEVMFHPKRGTLILAPSPLIAENLWGEQIEDKFVMFSVLRFCHNQKEWAPRIIPCAALCNSIGNLYLQPYPLADYRHSHTLGRFLSDHALNDLYNTLMDEKSGSPLMKKVVAETKKFFEPYRGADGWQLLVERWLIEGLVDYYWNPEPFFNDFTLNADIPTDVYFKALNQCIEMCHEIIPKRAKRMVQKLKDDL